MAKEIKGARFVLKRSNVPGETPTIPPNTDHTSGLWIDTDIYSGEMFLNVADSKMWFRNASNTGSVVTEMVQLVPLNSGGTIDTSYLPGNYLGAMVYQGTWDASSGNPPSTTPEKGDYWIVSVSGNTDLDGITDWQIGDFAIYNGSLNWDKIDNTEAVVYASDVLYNHSTYTSLTNASNAFDFLLDRFNYYSGSTNITLTDDGSGHGKTIALVASPTVTNLNATNISTTGYAQIGSYLNVTGNLHVTGTTTLYNNLSAPSHRITANELQTTDTLYFNTISNRLETDGLGIRFYQGGSLRLEFDNIGIATSYSKLRYDSSKTLDNNLDMVNKEYLDNYVALHNVGLWSSGGTTLDDPYKIIAWDGINTYYVGINIQNPTANLELDGTLKIKNGANDIFDVYTSASETIAEFTSTSGNRSLNLFTAGTSTVKLGYVDGAPNQFTLWDSSDQAFFNVYETSSTELFYNKSIKLQTLNTGILVQDDIFANGDINITGGIETNDGIETGGDILFKNPPSGDRKIGFQPYTASISRHLTIKGQDNTRSGGVTNAGDVIIEAGDCNVDDGGHIYINGGDGAVTSLTNGDGGHVYINGGNGGSSVLDDGGNIYIIGGNGGGNNGDLFLNGDNSSSYGRNIHFYAGDATTERMTIDSTTINAYNPVKIHNQIYTDKGTYNGSSSTNIIILNDVTPGEMFMINAIESQTTNVPVKYVSATVLIFFDDDLTTKVSAQISYIGNNGHTLSFVNETGSNCDIRLNNVSGDETTDWTILKLN